MTAVHVTSQAHSDEADRQMLGKDDYVFGGTVTDGHAVEGAEAVIEFSDGFTYEAKVIAVSPLNATDVYVEII